MTYGFSINTANIYANMTMTLYAVDEVKGREKII